MWAQRSNRQPLQESVMPGRTVVTGYMQWFYENRKSFVLVDETGAPSTSAGLGSAAEGPSTEPYTPMPPVFSHASSSQFQSLMAPPIKGFFAGAFQPYSSMMTAPLHSPGHFFPPPH
ncbi:hypothetical protein V6N13_108581 [Hibiscus sabdariffa]